MNLTASEQVTINFYQWEYQYRGYYHFDTPINIEIPYTPFHHGNYIQKPIEDDGRVPSLFKSLGNLLLPKPKEEEQEQEEIELNPAYIPAEDVPFSVGFSVSFQKGQDILPNSSIEFLNMLSFTQHSVSFEIVGRKDSIVIQFVCSKADKPRVTSHIKAYFPTVILRDVEIEDFGFDRNKDIAIADFGVNNEFMRPITTADSFAIDPLTSLIATMDTLQGDDVVVFQTIFKGITSPLAKDILYSVSDGAGGSFFSDAPEMPQCAMNKISNPLFSVVMRIATQGNSNRRSQYLTQELARSITTVSTSEYNKLIPLSNEGYDYGFHSLNLHNRLSNRLGFVLNSKELNTFIHYPNKSVVSKKLGIQGEKTKLLPQEAINQKYLLGVNHHNGEETEVKINDEARLRHTHIIGATGVGKSTLIANMMIEDMKAGNGCALFDPHGDIIEDILLRIPAHRKNDVIVIDPSDIEFPIGFNLLGATTELEKIVLSSDLVSSFKRHATAWGDNMTAVLSNAINAFLESNRSGTLIELKRFLLEDRFRKEFLESVEDPSIHYYWEHEYYMVKKGIAPLLTRIDTFLRPKIIRSMLAQNKGIGFKKCIEQKKIVLIKLSQGLIGEDNSYLLGSLFLSKFNQVAQGRQSLSKSERHPYYIYLDEFQNFITPSITRILSGARKYGLGLILAHQELGQIDDSKILNSVISNPYTRICFRLGDTDAKRLEQGFSYFEQSDLQSLGIGQAIIRIGSSANDCNISTFPLPEVNTEIANDIKNHIVQNTRDNYTKSKAEIDELLKSLLPKIVDRKNRKEAKQNIEKKGKQKDKEVPKVDELTEFIPLENRVSETGFEEKENTSEYQELASNPQDKKSTSDTSNVESEKQAYESRIQKREQLRKHQSIQDTIHAMAIQRGFKSVIEQPTNNRGRVDVGLTKDKIRIGIEISVTNTKAYETQNIIKCINDGFTYIVLVSESEVHLKNIQEHVQEKLSKKEFSQLHFCTPSEVHTFLDAFHIQPSEQNKRIQGYRVTTSYRDEKGSSKLTKQQELTDLIISSLGDKKS